MNRNAFHSRRFSLLSLGLLLAACPGGDPEPAGHPVTKPAPEEPPVKAPLVVPVADVEDVEDVEDKGDNKLDEAEVPAAAGSPEDR